MLDTILLDVESEVELEEELVDVVEVVPVEVELLNSPRWMYPSGLYTTSRLRWRDHSSSTIDWPNICIEVVVNACVTDLHPTLPTGDRAAISQNREILRAKAHG